MTLRDAFRNQAHSCTTMGSPFMGRLLTLLADNWPKDSALAHKFAQFSGDIGPAGHSLPLRLTGGLHALKLQGDAELAAVYPPNTPTDAALLETVLNALTTHEDFLDRWCDSAPQTNEVRRSIALMAGARVAAHHFDRPIALSELGASGGLNLMWDHYAVETPQGRFGATDPVICFDPDWRGDLPPEASPIIAERAGVDLTPLDPRNADDLLRMTAYLWADQPQRLERTRAAAAVMNTSIDQGDAIDWLESRLNAVPAGHLHLIQHSVAWQYFPQTTQTRGKKLIEAAGAKATAETPLAWMAMETDGDATGKVGAALTLRLWPGDITLHLGRADFHGRWIEWEYA